MHKKNKKINKQLSFLINSKKKKLLIVLFIIIISIMIITVNITNNLYKEEIISPDNSKYKDLLASDTGYNNPSDNGDLYDNWDNPTKAYSQNDDWATESTSGAGNKYHDFDAFNFNKDNIPAGATIDGIIIEIDVWALHTGGDVDVKLSWNGGSSWTSIKSNDNINTGSDTDYYYTFGSAYDTWERTWSASEFDNGNFYVYVEVSEGGMLGTTFYIDHIRAKVYYTDSDTTPPTPDPLTWSREPDADSSSAISMTSTTASDDSAPISYYFNETSGNSGGSDSGWQSADTTYTDSGLSENTQYGYECKAKDSEDNEGDYSTPISYEYTLCNAPQDSDVTIDSYGATWIKVYVDECPNPTAGSTDCYIDCTSGGASDADYGDTLRENSHFYYNFTGLTENTEYCFKAKYRNGDGVATALNGNAECQTTLKANVAPSLAGETPTNSSSGLTIYTSSVNVTISDDNGDTMDWTIEVSTGDTNNSNDDTNGSIDCSLTTPLSATTEYTWWVNVTDGTDWTNRTFNFTTGEQTFSSYTTLSFGAKLDAESAVKEFSLYTTISFGSKLNITEAEIELTNPSCHPESGVDSYTTFYFNVTWTQADGNDPTMGFLNVTINKTDWETNQSMSWVSGDNSTGAIYTYSTTLTAGSYNYTFWAYDATTHNSSGPHENPTVASQQFTFTVDTPSNDNLDFIDWTLSLKGVGRTTEYNVSEDNQTADVPALNITNTGNIPLNISIKWASDPGTGITMKYNVSNNAPNAGENSIAVHPSETQVISNLLEGNYEELWIWLDFVNVLAQSSNEIIRINSTLYNG